MASALLAKGSPRPAAVVGKLRLYGRPMSVKTERIQILLNLLNVPYDTVFISHESVPEWYTDIQPEGKIPALETGNDVVSELSSIVRFLLSQYTSVDLIDLDHKDDDKILTDKFYKVDELFTRALTNGKIEDIDNYHKEVLEAMRYFVSELKRRGSQYLKGNAPGIADFLVWPTIERVKVISSVAGKDLPFTDADASAPDDKELIMTWVFGITQVQAVQEAKIDQDLIVNYIKHLKHI